MDGLATRGVAHTRFIAGWMALILGGACLDFFPPVAATVVVGAVVLILTRRRLGGGIALAAVLLLLEGAVQVMATVSGPDNALMLAVAAASLLVTGFLVLGLLPAAAR